MTYITYRELRKGAYRRNVHSFARPRDSPLLMNGDPKTSYQLELLNFREMAKEKGRIEKRDI